MNTKMHLKKIPLLLLILVLVSCAPTGSVTPKQTVLSETSTVQPTKLPATHTAAATSHLSPTPTLAPTLISQPDLTQAEINEQVLSLLKNNGDCQLPCFWGFMPTQTKEFGLLRAQFMNNDGEILIKQNSFVSKIVIDFRSSKVENHDIGILTYSYHETEPSKSLYGSPSYSGNFKYYSLPNLLTAYGVPEESYVILDTGIQDMGLGIDLYLLSIEYPTKGWLAVFKMPLRRYEKVILGCPSEAEINLRLWMPGRKPSGTFLGGFGGNDKSYLFTIKEATGMTLGEFYYKFKNPENTACLETPMNISR